MEEEILIAKVGSLVKIPNMCFNMGIPIFRNIEEIEASRRGIFGRIDPSYNVQNYVSLLGKVGLCVDYHLIGANTYIQVLFGEEAFWISFQYLKVMKP